MQCRQIIIFDEVILNAIFEGQLRNPDTFSAYFVHIVPVSLVQLQVDEGDSAVEPFDFDSTK